MPSLLVLLNNSKSKTGKPCIQTETINFS
uniref:Uncharacterized protein n=1 Tax=Anguilla anguilla TaxID=7936 RepID=A0A0E9UX79_ANGAN